MTQLEEQALSLVAEALGQSVTVTMEHPGTVRLIMDRRPSLTLRMVLPHETETAELGPTPILWVLRRPKRAALQDLRGRGQSFVALNGAVRIQAPGLLIDRTDLRLPGKGGQTSRRSAFSDRASLIPRWLFSHPTDSEWTVSELAEHAGVSHSIASYAAKDLEHRHLVEAEAKGRERRIRLVGHRQLIVEWAREYDWRDNPSLAVHAPMGSPERFLRRLAALPLPRYALTLQAGASLIFPHTVVEQINVYVDVRSQVSLADLARTLDWPADSAAGFRFLLPRYKTAVWEGTRHRDGVPVVSDLQLMLDLWRHPVRGREQAELLLEKHVLSLLSA